MKMSCVHFFSYLDNSYQSGISDARAKWNIANNSPSFAFKYNGKIVTPEEVVNLLINGKYFHKDEDKRLVLKGLDSRTEILFKLAFLLYIKDGNAHIRWLDRLIKHAIRNGLLSG
jgi:hypothetical protein